nr:unnamed protein product [Spirometra erinaceieuropaei]
MEEAELPGRVEVDGPSLCPVQKCRQEDEFVYLPFGIQLEVVAIPYGVLQPVEGLVGIGDPVGHFVVDSDAARHSAVAVVEVVHGLESGDVGAGVFSGPWLLINDHLPVFIGGQSEVGAAGGEEIHAPFHLLLDSAVERAVVS